MSSEKRPWYKWFPKDFVADEKVKSLSPISELVYRRLLDTMWQSSACVLLNDCLRLANVAGAGLLPEEFKKAWDEIQTPGYELFKITEDGQFIYSSRMQAQMQEIEIKAEAGKKGGKKSGEARRKQKRSKSEAKANDTDTDTDNRDIINNISTAIFDFTSQAIDSISNHMGSLAPKKTESLLKNSADTIDKLIRIDGFDLDYIKSVIEWAMNDDFWKKNALSLSSLRKKSKSNDLTKFQNMANSFEQSKATRLPERTRRSIQAGEEFRRKMEKEFDDGKI